ncbi:MAG: DNA polymerase I [Clostridia bacterium]|nr:DNA polymerase I [Clostridia bacterium]
MRLLAMDANSIVNRAFYGVKPLTTKDGQYTNALFGFLNIFSRLKEQVQPDAIVAAFDLHAPTFRHKLYDGYKAGRKPMPEELRSQMPILKELLPLLGCHIVECEGYEADDILGTLATAARRGGDTCVIATGDRDSLQLVGDGVEVWLAATRNGAAETVVMDEAAIMEKYGLAPARLIDLKALMGDASDRIPGVPGVGEKTALELLHTFGSLDGLYAHLDDPHIKEGVRRKLTEGRDSAALSLKLGTICCQVPISTDLTDYRAGELQKAPLAALLTRLEFFKMMEKWGLSAADATPVAETVAAELPALRRAPLSLVLSAPGPLTVWPTAESLWLAADGVAGEVAYTDPAWETVAARLCDPNVEKLVHDGKPLFARLLKGGCIPAGFVMDTALAAYLLNPLSSDYTLARLAPEYGLPLPPEGELPWELAVLPPLAALFREQLAAQGQNALLNEVELPLAVVLADMENEGFAVDAAGIAAYGERLSQQIAGLESAIYEAVGYTFNLNSPKQLGKALFEDLGLPAKKKTKSGYSTNAEVLEGLRHAHPAVEMLLSYRTLAKLKSTYCDGLLKVVGEDGRIRSSFNQTETRTGRISSAEPNLQNIPVRTPLGRELRRFFKAREGYRLVDADYSQIELRVLAHMAADPTMCDAFNTGVDIHSVTASQVFGVPLESVTPLMRSRAKAVNFGIVYGIGPHSLAEDIGVSYKEAKQYIDGYLAHYGGVADFMQRLIDEAKADGYAKPLWGRRRPLPELRTGNAMTRSFGERVARNMPIQGPAADIIKVAMVRVWQKLRQEFPAARLILQVHDELIVEAPEAEAAAVAELLSREMAAAAQLAVRLETDVQIGKTWFDTKE